MACATKWDSDGLATTPEWLVLGGANITAAGPIQCSNVAAWDGTNWHAIGAGFNGPVRAIANHQGTLVVTGTFTQIDGQTINLVARWDGAHWVQLGTGLSGTVTDIEVYNGQVIIGGYLGLAGGTPSYRIARWDGTAWRPFELGGVEKAFNGMVQRLAIYNGELVVGGAFTTAGSRPVRYVARWTPTGWDSYGLGIPEADIDVRVLESVSGRLFAGGLRQGGWFHSINSLWDPAFGDWMTTNPISLYYVRSICDYAGVTYSAHPDFGVSRLDQNFWRAVTGTPASVGFVTEYQGALYVGGAFTSIGSTQCLNLVRWMVPTADFNHDGDLGTDQDIEAFFACIGGTCCGPCGSADFNADGDVATDQDIESFFRMLGGGSC